MILAFCVRLPFFLLSQENVGGTTYFYPASANHTSSQVASTVGPEQALSSHSNSQSLNYPHPGNSSHTSLFINLLLFTLRIILKVMCIQDQLPMC